MGFAHHNTKADRIVVHSVVEECRQIWLRDLGLSKEIRKSATLREILETEFRQALQILRRENVLKKSMKNQWERTMIFSRMLSEMAKFMSKRELKQTCLCKFEDLIRGLFPFNAAKRM
jgi:hypothetical protein